MSKKFIPLWFSDVIATENKLTKLAEQGQLLTDFSRVTGVFTFEEGEKTSPRYRICLCKGMGSIPKGLAANGWEEVCAGKGYYVVKHPDINVKDVPSYSAWKTLSRTVLVIFFLILCFALGMLGGYMGAALEDGAVFFDSPLDYVIVTFGCISLIGLLFGSKGHSKLSKTDSDLKLKGKLLKTIPEDNFIYTPEEEKEMLRSGRMITKFPLGWFYGPDKAGEMVENMAEKGWKFYRLNNMGTVFYFIKSDPCKLKFVTDYQNEATDEYFLAGKDDGWKLEFTSVTRSMSFVVWTKEYEGEDEPEFYTDGECALKHAKSMMLTFSLPMFITVAALIFIMVSAIADSADIFDDASGIFMVAVICLCSVEYLYFAVKTIGFYIRTRKNTTNKQSL